MTNTHDDDLEARRKEIDSDYSRDDRESDLQIAVFDRLIAEYEAKKRDTLK